MLMVLVLDRATFFTDDVRRDFLEEMGQFGSFSKCSYFSLSSVTNSMAQHIQDPLEQVRWT